MNIEEMIRNLKNELAGLKSRLAEHDEAAAKRAQEIMDVELPDLEAKKAAAERFGSLMERIGSGNSEQKDACGEAKAKTFGEFVAKSVAGQFKRGERNSLFTPEWDGAKAAASTMTTPSSLAPWLADYDRNMVLQPRRRLTVADLLGSESISGNAIKYLVESATVNPDSGAPGTVAEGASKPQISYGDPTAVTESLYKLAVFYKESDEIMEDAAWLASNIQNRAIYQLQLYEEDQLLGGTGSSGTITGILNRSGIQTQAYEADIADVIFKAMTKVETATGFEPDAIVINPADYQTLRLMKDSNNQYFGGGFFQGQYGQDGIMEKPPIWGLRTVVTSAIASGTALVGAFKQGASVFRKGGLRVEMTNSNEDDFKKNLVMVRIEERLGLAVRYPAAFVKATLVNPL